MKIYTYTISKSEDYERDLSVVIPTPSIEKELFKKAKKSIEENAKHVNVNIYLNAVVDSGPNFRYSRSVNRGLEEISADFYLNMNDDVILDPHALHYAIQDFDSIPNLGLLGALLYYPDGRVQHAGVYFVKMDKVQFYSSFPWLKAPIFSLKFTLKYLKAYKKYRVKDYMKEKHPKELNGTKGVVNGAFQLFPNITLIKTKGYDENYIMGEEDFDFCLKVINQGKLVRLDKRVTGTHYSHHSKFNYSIRYAPHQRLYLLKKWDGVDNIIRLIEKNGPLWLNKD